MILNLFIAFNSYLECSGQPQFDDHTPEVFANSFKRHLLTCDDSKAFTFENVIWYHLGTYDDETMELIPNKGGKVKILDCNDVLSTRKLKAKLLEAAREKESKEVVNG